MRTIRRLYLYTVTAISLEIVLWGVVNLLRAMADTQRVGGSAIQLAGALATIIVGLPVFFLHWWLIQRRIPHDAEERGAGVRAIFLYGLLFGLLIPVAQNVLSILNRAFIGLFDLGAENTLLGFNQTWVDNGIALIMNALLAAYFMVVLRGDWQAGAAEDDEAAAPPQDNLTLMRRIFRYALVLYSLGLLVFGVQQILEYIIEQVGPPNVNALAPLANGLSLSLFGALLWWSSWTTVQKSRRQGEEQRSLFRLVLLYVLVFISVGTVLLSLGDVLFEALRIALGESESFKDWLLNVSGSVAVGIPFAGLWIYHASVLRGDLSELPDTPRRAAFWRLYRYVLAFIGLIVTFTGISLLAAFLMDFAFDSSSPVDRAVRNSLAGGLAALIIGIPLWVRPWGQVAGQAAQEGEEGDRARRSAVRKAYLYLAIFIGVVGVMIHTGDLIFRLLSTLLGEKDSHLLQDGLQALKSLLLFAALLAYHWQVLRRDNTRADRTLAEKHSLFPALILDSGDETFAGPILAAIRDQASGMPVAVHFTGAGVPGEDLSGAGAVVLPSGMAANPPEALRIWLQAYSGVKIVVPVSKPGWLWVDVDSSSKRKQAKQVAAALCKMAEGETLERGGRTSPWGIVAAVFGALVGLVMLISLIAELFNF